MKMVGMVKGAGEDGSVLQVGRSARLVILGGLPATGKTTIAQGLCKRLACAHVRVDTIEQSLRSSYGSVTSQGYEVAYAVAEDCLSNGVTVIADSVNPLEITRQAWLRVAQRCRVGAVEIEIVRSDPDDHRRWVESRQGDILGLVQPQWKDVVDRSYDPWLRPHHVIDTSGQSREASIAQAHALLAGI